MKHNRCKIYLTVVLSALLLIGGSLFATGTREFSGPMELTILGTTDIHGNIWGFSYENDKETTNNGMARIASFYVPQQL